MTPSKFSFQLTPTNPESKLGFEAWINDQCVFDTDHVGETTIVNGDLPDDSSTATHTLKLVLKNKQSSYTQVSETGEILEDSCLEVSNLLFDKIELGQIVNEKTVYTHDFNGTGTESQHQFFGTMGCNGTVELQFTTPVYLWLLENM
jgi:hypothetical protein